MFSSHMARPTPSGTRDINLVNVFFVVFLPKQKSSGASITLHETCFARKKLNSTKAEKNR